MQKPRPCPGLLSAILAKFPGEIQLHSLPFFRILPLHVLLQVLPRLLPLPQSAASPGLPLSMWVGEGPGKPAEPGQQEPEARQQG